MKKVLGHVITFTLGTMVSGTVATAAVTNYIQAQKLSANVVISGKSSTTTELVYNGHAYLPIGDLQSILGKAGVTSKWSARHLSITLPAKTPAGQPTPTGNGKEAQTNLAMIKAITTSMLDLGGILKDVGTALIADGQTNNTADMKTAIQTALTKITTNYQTVSQVKSGDAAGQKILTDYLAVVTQYQNTFQDLMTALNNNDSTLATKAQDEINAANTAFSNFNTEWAAFLKS